MNTYLSVLIFHCLDGGWLCKAAVPVNGVYLSVERPTLESVKRAWQKKYWDLVFSCCEKENTNPHDNYRFCIVSDAAYEDYIEQCAREIWNPEEKTDNISVRVIDDFEYIESHLSADRSDDPDYYVYLSHTNLNLYDLDRFAKKLDIGLTNMSIHRNDDGEGLVLFWDNMTIWHPASQEGMFIFLTRRVETEIGELKEVRQSYLVFHKDGDILLADTRIGTWSMTKEQSFMAELHIGKVQEVLSDAKKLSLLQQVAKVIPDDMIPLSEDDLKDSILQKVLRL